MKFEDRVSAEAKALKDASDVDVLNILDGAFGIAKRCITLGNDSDAGVSLADTAVTIAACGLALWS